MLILVLTQQLLSVQRTYRFVSAFFNEVIELQWVFDAMRVKIHHAGFAPCLGLNHLTMIDTRDHPENLQAIEIIQGDLPQLVIRKMDEQRFGLTQILGPTQLSLSTKLFRSDRPIIIADCEHAEVHEIEKARLTKLGYLIQLQKPLVFHYANEVYAGAWLSETFYFRKLKGLLMKRHRIDLMVAAKAGRFYIKKQHEYFTVKMTLISKLNKSYRFVSRTRMP